MRSIVNKILIQVNAKVGGVPWAVDSLPLLEKPSMVCGMDVFHSTALGKKSVLALTASMNQTATKYWATSVIQGAMGEEASFSLTQGISKALEKFKKLNGIYPARVIFYRDGVGEGQVAGICKPEIDHIGSAFAALNIPQIQLLYQCEQEGEYEAVRRRRGLVQEPPPRNCD